MPAGQGEGKGQRALTFYATAPRGRSYSSTGLHACFSRFLCWSPEELVEQKERSAKQSCLAVTGGLIKLAGNWQACQSKKAASKAAIYNISALPDKRIAETPGTSHPERPACRVGGDSTPGVHLPVLNPGQKSAKPSFASLQRMRLHLRSSRC